MNQEEVNPKDDGNDREESSTKAWHDGADMP